MAARLNSYKIAMYIIDLVRTLCHLVPEPISDLVPFLFPTLCWSPCALPCATPRPGLGHDKIHGFGFGPRPAQLDFDEGPMRNSNFQV